MSAVFTIRLHQSLFASSFVSLPFRFSRHRIMYSSATDLDKRNIRSMFLQERRHMLFIAIRSQRRAQFDTECLCISDVIDRLVARSRIRSRTLGSVCRQIRCGYSFAGFHRDLLNRRRLPSGREHILVHLSLSRQRVLAECERIATVDR